MPDLRGRLQSMFAKQHRHANFDDVIERIEIDGFRCHSNTIIDIESPITAFSGLNGTGKSTVLQLAANAYKASGGRVWRISDFFSINPIDRAPFRNGARVVYQFAMSNGRSRPLTLSRSFRSSRWLGYNRRFSRRIFFAGIGNYLPLAEQTSYVYRSRGLAITASSPASERRQAWIKRILRADYTEVEDHTLSTNGRRGNNLISFTRGGSRYAEPNMGFGEGRTGYIVGAIENLPPKSLVLLEEPETSLHPSAQYELGCYLVDVAIAKGLQIFISTHSEHLQKALPDASRIFLQRVNGGIKPIPGLSASQANSLMTEGERPALTIVVEDDVAVAVMHEIMRDAGGPLLRTVKVAIGGSNDVLKKTMTGLSACGLNVAAVADGDTPANPQQNLFKLPGTQPPEKEIFGSAAFTTLLRTEYGFDLADFRTSLADVNHHEWFGKLSEQIRVDRSALVAEGARIYVRALPPTEKGSLCESLRAAIRT